MSVVPQTSSRVEMASASEDAQMVEESAVEMQSYTFPDGEDSQSQGSGNQLWEGDSDLHEELELIQKLLDEERQRNEKLTDLVGPMGRELETLRKDKAVLQGQVEACKDDLFRLRPSTQVPDSTITQMWNDLKEEVSVWIDGEIMRIETQSTHRNRSPPLLFCDGGEGRVKKYLKDYPDTGGEYLIRATIHGLLQENLFDCDTLLFGLASKTDMALKTVQTSMEAYRPRKDPVVISAWLSEALTSIAASQDYLRSRREEMVYSAKYIFQELSRFFPMVKGRHESLKAFYNKIVRPAVDLAVMLQTSPSCYRFKPRCHGRSLFMPDKIAQVDIGQTKLTDVETGKTLKINSKVNHDQNGWIGTKIMTLAPALWRCDPNKAEVKLTQEVALVKLNPPPVNIRGNCRPFQEPRIMPPRHCRNQGSSVAHSGSAIDVDNSATQNVPGAYPH